MASPLAGVALFKELPEPGLEMLAERGRPKHFAAEVVIMRQGEASDALHVITRGRVRVQRGQAGETPLVLAELDTVYAAGYNTIRGTGRVRGC